jgi:hypothetical protein
MKHILPIITITTLAAAASAQTAAASSGLSYNRVGVAYSDNLSGYGLTASALIGSSNFLVSGSTTIGGGTAGNGNDNVSLSYVFKNAALGADAIVSVGSNENYGIAVRKDLGSNIELGLGFERSQGVNLWGIELAYNLTKQYQIAVSYLDAGNGTINGKGSDTQIAVRYNF